MTKISGAAIVLCILIQLSPSRLQNSICVQRTKCNECIKRPECAWCSQEKFQDKDGNDAKRCDTRENLITFGCNSSSISNPDSRIPRSKNISLNNQVQVTPQEVKLELRPGKPVHIRLTVRPAEDYPVDLYYVMDLSDSMKDDLASLKSLAVKIAAEMKKITKNFQLGFGSFVDKAIAPITQIERQESCRALVGCTPTYGFKHSLKLTKNDTLFEQEVKKQTISGNLDAPEGGFDALMQVATCENYIGWLPSGTSRRLVLMVTDAQFHVAGDGKIGGVIKRNDEKCHLLNGEYSYSTELDYPTIAQLHTQLRKHKILPIFAVTKQVIDVYKSVTSRPKWSDLGAVANELKGDSSNIVDIIRDSYNQIVSTVKLSYNAPPGIKVEHTAHCGNYIKTPEKGCNGVPIGHEVQFDVSVTLEQCPEDSKQQLPEKFTIRVPGFGEVDLDIDFICRCDCEAKWNQIENSTQCNNGGDYGCGICDCHKGRYGTKCKCDNPFDNNQGTSKCKQTNSTEEPVCSGRGQCICDICHCNKGPNEGRIYGDKCQCDDFSCPEFNELPCGGPERGICDCGECQCKGVWTGTKNCGKQNCSLLDFQCKKPGDAEICSTYGKCDCGKCKCDDKHTGTYCGECPTCEGGICNRNKDCIECTAGIEKRSLDDCKKLNRCEAQIVRVTGVDDITKKISEKAGRCDHRANDCVYLYTYRKTDEKNYELFVQEKCPEEPNVLLIVLATIGGILLLGLLLLIIWKLLVSWADRKEYQRFQHDLLMSQKQIHESALYEGPITTTENITYAGKR